MKHVLASFLSMKAAVVAVLILACMTVIVSGQENPLSKASGLLPQPSPTPVPRLVPVRQHQVFEPTITSRAALVYDVGSNTVLYSRQPDLRLLPASTTKIMTALVALSEYDLDDIVEVQEAEEAIGNSVELVAGDRLRVMDVLKALLISSGNDAAVALALHHPRGYQYFVSRMNSKAEALGLTNSHFANVSGIESANHYMSAQDLMTLTRTAMENQLFMDIVGTTKTTIQTIDGNRVYTLENTNKLLDVVPGMEGVKTGWTGNAKECLVTQVRRDKATIITVVLGSDDRFGDSQQLIEWTFAEHLWRYR